MFNNLSLRYVQKRGDIHEKLRLLSSEFSQNWKGPFNFSRKTLVSDSTFHSKALELFVTDGQMWRR
jgi:hypothetical protein